MLRNNTLLVEFQKKKLCYVRNVLVTLENRNLLIEDAFKNRHKENNGLLFFSGLLRSSPLAVRFAIIFLEIN